MVNKNSGINPKTYVSGKVLLVDPNPENNEIVTPDNLNITVKLKTIKRVRSSIIIDETSSNISATIASGNNDGVINFIGGSNLGGEKALTTHYTELNTNFNKKNGDLETLGITNIKIDFNTAYAPLITIDFTDVRGKLFEMGDKSPYSVFFNLPYPIFELTIKGYYGKPVTYCLHLTKFTGKLNDKNGNFEITTSFIGYTFAFLSDMLVGYLRAIPSTEIGRSKTVDKVGFISFDELESNINQLDVNLGKLKKTDKSLKSLAFAENLIGRLKEFKGLITNSLSTLTSGNIINSTNGGFTIVTSKATDNAIELEFEDKFNSITKDNVKVLNEILGVDNHLTNEYYQITDGKTKFKNVLKSDFSEHKLSDYLENVRTPLSVFSEINVENISKYSKFRALVNSTSKGDDFKIYYLIDGLKEINGLITKLESETKLAKKNVATEYNKKTSDILSKKDINGNIITEFEPTIYNFFKILSDHVDIFMDSLRELAARIENDPSKRKRDIAELLGDVDSVVGDNNNLLAWPDYKVKNDESNGYIDKWIGADKKDLPEVIFIEDMLTALIDTKRRDNKFTNVLDYYKEGWVGINPFDTSVYIENPWLSVANENHNAVIRLMSLRAITYLSYTNKNLTENEILAMSRIEANNAYKNILNREVKDVIVNRDGGDISLITDSIIHDLEWGLDEWVNNRPIIINHKYNAGGQFWSNNKNLWQYIYTPVTKNTTIEDSVKPYTTFLPLHSTIKTSESIYTSEIMINKKPNETYWVDKTNEVVTDSDRVKLREDGVIFFSNQIGPNGSTAIIQDDGGTYFDIITKAEYNLSLNSFPEYASDILNELKFENVNYNTINKGDTVSWGQKGIKDKISPFGGKYGVAEFTTTKVGKGFNLGETDEIPTYLTFYNTTRKPIITGRRIKNSEGKIIKTIYDITVDSVRNGNNVTINSATKLFPNNYGVNLPLEYNIVNFDKYRYGIRPNNRGTNNILALYNAKNVTVTNLAYNDDVSIFGSDFYHTQENEYAKAYLFLNTLPFDGIGDTSGSYSKSSADDSGTLFNNTIINYFNNRGGFTEAPISWILFIGAILKRMEKEYLLFDVPNQQYSLISNVTHGYNVSVNELLTSGYNKSNTTQSPQATGTVNNGSSKTLTTVKHFTFLDKNILKTVGVKAPSKINVGETLNRLPNNIKKQFITFFENWVDNSNGFGNLKWGDIKSEFQLFKDGVSRVDRVNYWSTYYITNNTDLLTKLQSPLINGKSIENHIIVKRYNDILINDTVGNINNVFSLNNRGSDINFYLEVKDDSIGNAKLIKFLNETRMLVNSSWRNFSTDSITRVSTKRHPFRFDKDEFKLYVKSFITEFKKLNLNDNEKDKNDEIKRELFNSIDNDDIKLNMYKNIKSIHDKWVAGGKSKCSSSNLIEHFKFIDRSYSDVSSKFKLNPNNTIKYLVSDYNQSFYEYISRILSDNNFDFIPLPNWVNHTKGEEIKNVFKTYSYVDAFNSSTDNNSGPQFVCMYIGQRSNKLDLGSQSQYGNDGFDFKIDNGSLDATKLPQDMVSPKDGDNSKVPAFLVKYGGGNQSIFKGFKLDQSEFTETDESLRIINDISNKGGPNNASGLGQNLFNVYNTRSYSAEIEMMGNAQIQPLMYFQLSNVPMFHGAYTIIKVSHVIKPNTMSTTFKGVRVRHVKTKMVDDTTIFMNLIGSLNDVNYDDITLNDLSKVTHGQPEWAGCVTYKLKDGKGLMAQDKSALSKGLKTKGSGDSDGKGIIVSWTIEEIGKFIEKIGKDWYKTNESETHGDTLYYNDLSFYGGGDISTHSTHNKGLSIDIRMIRNDKKNGAINLSSSAYDKEQTIKLIELILDEALKSGLKSKGNQVINVIYFNDSYVINHFKNYKGYGRNMVVKSKGHHNHFHIRFNLPDRISNDETNGYIICKETLPPSP